MFLEGRDAIRLGTFSVVFPETKTTSKKQVVRHIEPHLGMKGGMGAPSYLDCIRFA